HHDLSVLLADDRGWRGQAGRIRAEQKLRAVLIDQSRVELLYAAADRLIVITDEIDLIALAAGLDAAPSSDLVAPELVAALLTARVDIERTGLGIGKADGDGVFGEGRRDKGRRHRQGETRGSQKGKRKQPFH